MASILTLQHEAPGADRLWERSGVCGARGASAVKRPWPCPSRRLGCPPRPEQLQQVVGEADHLPLLWSARTRCGDANGCLSAEFRGQGKNGRSICGAQVFMNQSIRI
jgi:hypothetical protein